MSAIESWWESGTRRPIDLGSGREPLGLFTRVRGDGPWLTVLHGFPTSSWDWSQVAALLDARYRVLALDWYGFGNSDKPKNHTYTIAEQTDLLEAVWAREGVMETFLLSHDYGDTVTQEVLLRAQRNRLPVKIRGAVLLNGTLYGALQRPLLIQRLLTWPFVGAAVTRLVSEQRFAKNFQRVFGPDYEASRSDLHEQWLAITRHGGNLIYHRLMHFYREQRVRGQSWEAAMESTAVPLLFVWGMADPVSGLETAQLLEQRVSDAQLCKLERVGHCPHIEVPDRVATEVDNFCNAVRNAG